MHLVDMITLDGMEIGLKKLKRFQHNMGETVIMKQYLLVLSSYAVSYYSKGISSHKF